MDGMHEELLKLRGSFSIENNWDMVQRNNKSSEIWKNKFVPSKLSDILWGNKGVSLTPIIYFFTTILNFLYDMLFVLVFLCDAFQ